LELNHPRLASSRPPRSGLDRRGGYESCSPRNSSGQANQLSYLAKFLFLFLGLFQNIGYLPKHLFFIPFHPISIGLRVLDPLKTECKYEGLLSEMQIGKELRN
jgi:hypothetical protein